MKKKVIVRAPILTQSGYGEHARFTMRALRAYEEHFDIYAIPIEWGKLNWEWQDTPERKWLDEIIEKTLQYNAAGGTYDLSIQVTIPNEWEKIAPINIGVTAGMETSAIAPEWIEKSQLVDRIITISEHSKTTYLNTAYDAQDPRTGQVFKNFRCSTPVDIVRYPVKKTHSLDLDLNLDYDFNFFTNAVWTPRKNLDNTIKWFVEEFVDQEVGLVVKTNVMKNCLYDKYMVEGRLAGLLSKYPDRKCKVYLLHGYMKEEEMSSVFSHEKIKAYVCISHGEGFGLPVYEAAYHGIPVIAPEWSGYVDFMRVPIKDKKGKEKMRSALSKVDYSILPVQREVVWKGVINEDMKWCFPDQGSYKMKLREVFKDYGRFKKRAGLLQKHLTKTYTAENQYKKVFDSISKVVDFQLDEEVNELFDQLMNQG
tara:strand:+ start:1718 stop:2989 length:1272 start_codon:yes stop_codon:yes gene_type:complete